MNAQVYLKDHFKVDMHALTTIRTNEWWEYKFPPILAIGYLVIANSGYPFINQSGILAMLLLSLITGAAYVSMLNDATDIADDAVAGKENRMARFSHLKKILLLSVPLLIGSCFTFYFYTADIFTMLLYLCCYLCFTFYSLPPFRLKKKGISGVLADAAGSQLFPTLFIAAFLYFKTAKHFNYFEFIALGAWSFCFGIRGILWHQFTDLKKDLLSGTKTVVQWLNEKEIVFIGYLLVCIELTAFLILLVTFRSLLPAIMLLLYFFYAIALYKKWRVETILIKPTQDAYRIFLNEYYQVFLPVAILVSVVREQPSALIILFFHIALFPFNTVRIFKESFRLLLKNRRSVQISKVPSV